jgi:hypothetical protein
MKGEIIPFIRVSSRYPIPDACHIHFNKVSVRGVLKTIFLSQKRAISKRKFERLLVSQRDLLWEVLPGADGNCLAWSWSKSPLWNACHPWSVMEVGGAGWRCRKDGHCAQGSSSRCKRTNITHIIIISFELCHIFLI